MTQLLLLGHRQSLLCPIIQRPHVINRRHLTRWNQSLGGGAYSSEVNDRFFFVQLSQNPLSADGVLVLLRTVRSNAQSALEDIDLTVGPPTAELYIHAL